MNFGGLGMMELVLIFIVVLLLFGAKRLPEIGTSLGKGIREFKSSVRDIEKEIQTPDEEEKGSISSATQANDDDDGGPRSLTSSS
jgi:TatA/E family protein of Tat protein translocase